MRADIITALLFCISFLDTEPAQAGSRSMVCRGEMGNAFLPESPHYKIFGQRTFYITTLCSFLTENVIGAGECDYTFNGSRHKGYLHPDGAFKLSHLGPFSYLEQGGYLAFKLSETTNGVGGNEGQRWFRGHCETTR